MRLKYVGIHEEVEIPELDLVVKNGEIVEVDDDVGKRMAEQDDWQVTSRSSKKGDDA